MCGFIPGTFDWDNKTIEFTQTLTLLGISAQYKGEIEGELQDGKTQLDKCK